MQYSAVFSRAICIGTQYIHAAFTMSKCLIRQCWLPERLRPTVAKFSTRNATTLGGSSIHSSAGPAAATVTTTSRIAAINGSRSITTNATRWLNRSKASSVSLVRQDAAVATTRNFSSSYRESKVGQHQNSLHRKQAYGSFGGSRRGQFEKM